MVTAKGGVGRESYTLESPNLGKLLRSTYPYAIPEYQRPFSWTDQQLEDYVGDLVGLVDLARHTRSVEPYFFGAVITLERRTGKNADDRVLEVVDGQQRLTVFYLTLAELRRRLLELRQSARALKQHQVAKSALEEVAALEKRLFMEPPSLSEPLIPRFVPGGVDVEFYGELIEGAVDPATPLAATHPASHRRLAAACGAIRDELVGRVEGGGSPRERLQGLRLLRECLLELSYVIHAGSSSEAEAYRLFLALNDRGTPLTEADLLRTKTLELLRGYDAARAVAVNAWQPLVDAEDPRRYLQTFYGMKTGRRPESKDLHRQFLREPWLGTKATSAKEAQRIVDFASELGADFAIYNLIMTGKWPYEGGTADPWDRDRLYRLVMIVRQVSTAPLLLALAHGPEARFIAALRVIERFAFRYVVAKGHPSTVADFYFHEAKEYRNDASRVVAELEVGLADLQVREVPDGTFRGALGDLRYGAAPTNSLIKHALSTLDDYRDWYDAGHSGRPSPSRIGVWNVRRGDLDHIYPKSPMAGHSDTGLDAVRDHVGNLTFLESPLNRRARNQPFSWKQANIYGSVNQPSLTRALSDPAIYPSWTTATVLARQDDLIERMVQTFCV